MRSHLLMGREPAKKKQAIPMKSMTYKNQMRRRYCNEGFTLIELLVVGALISLFAGLAIFGVQQQFRSNRRKATIGEARQVATALDFANLDTSIFPKLCWLAESQEGMDLQSFRLSGNTGSTLAFNLLDVNSRITSNNTAARRQWNGPYFAFSQTRAGLSQGRGGIVNMLLAESDDSRVNAVEMRWPADPFGSPWVVYMLDLIPPGNTGGGGNGRLSFVNNRAAGDPTVKGNYVNAVVSYGENMTPGGSDSLIPPNGPTNVNDLNATGSFPWSMRLYTGSFKKGATMKTLPSAAYVDNTNPAYSGGSNPGLAVQRANVWSQAFYGGTGLPNNHVGISDETSDDIVFEF